MEYLPLGDLRQQNLEQSVTLQETETIFCQMLSALQHLHSKGFAHRDVKPANILVASRSPLLTKLADFDMVNSLDRLITQCGTYHYAAPEIFVLGGFRGKRKWRYAMDTVDGKETGATPKEYTAAVDVWSLAVVILELTVGLPDTLYHIHGEWAQHVRNRIDGTAESLPRELHQTLSQMLELVPEELISISQCLLPVSKRSLQKPASAVHRSVLSSRRTRSTRKILSRSIEAGRMSEPTTIAAICNPTKIQLRRYLQ